MKVQSLMKSIGDNACLCMDYIYSTMDRMTPTERSLKYVMVNHLFNLWEEGYVDDNFFVKDAEKLLKRLTGKKYFVLKKNVANLEELKEVPKACVRFDYNGNSHWVYTQYGVITFDSLDDSVCRKKGRLVAARIIKEY